MPWISINQWKKRNGVGKVKPKKKVEKPVAPKTKPVFKLVGYDMFSDEWHTLDEFPTEKKAKQAGIKKLEELAIQQPAELDRVFIETPEGRLYQVIG